jgi:hypothetical protein
MRMIITGVLFAEKFSAGQGGNKVDVVGGSPLYYVASEAPDNPVTVPVLLFITPGNDDLGERVDLEVSIVDTNGNTIGVGHTLAFPNARVGNTISAVEVPTHFEREWRYALHVGKTRIIGFDVYFSEPGE